MRRLLALSSAGLLLLGTLALATGAAAGTIGPTTSCANGIPNTAGLGLICEVTVVNTITAAGGSATVTLRECHGAAGDPTAACTTTTNTVSSPVTTVSQCNSALNGGGATVRCKVRVRNNFVGVSAGLRTQRSTSASVPGTASRTTVTHFPRRRPTRRSPSAMAPRTAGPWSTSSARRPARILVLPTGQDQPVQWLSQRRWRPRHLLREHCQYGRGRTDVEAPPAD